MGRADRRSAAVAMRAPAGRPVARGRRGDRQTTVGHWRVRKHARHVGQSSGNGLVLRSGALAAAGRHRSGDAAALVDFCHVLLNSNEFLYVD